MREIKKVMMAAVNYDHPQRGMLYGLGKIFGKENVLDFDYLSMKRAGNDDDKVNRAFMDAALSFKPDLVWLQIQDSNVLKDSSIYKLKESLPSCIFTHWTGDLRHEVSPYLASFCRATDITFISSVGQLALFKAAGACHSEYCQVGLDWEEDILGIPEWTPSFRIPDVVFCGNFYGKSFPGTKDRAEAIVALKNYGIDIGIVGTGWPQGYPVVGACHVKQQHHVWKRAKVCLNINNFQDVSRYYSDRQIIAMASGRPTVCKYIPSLESEFKNWDHCVWYRSIDELVITVKKLLGDPVLCGKIGLSGKNEVVKNHTWEKRFRDFVLPEINRIF